MAVDSPSPAPSRPVRSQALDGLIMGTNSSSIVSKRSVERLYYPHEPHFFRYFVSKFQRRAPVINRGYWLRLRAVDVLVRQFLSQKSSRNKVVVNLGCGSDVLPWQCHARYPESCQNALFVDVDYPDLMLKKRTIVMETPQLHDLLGANATISESPEDPVLLRSDKYCQVACDLRELGVLQAALQSILDLPACDVLFVAEVSVTYMDTPFADALLQWASSIGHAQFCLLEQILPHGPDHPFALTMLNHFDKLKTPPMSVHRYPTLASQRSRFLGRGWDQVDIWDLWETWSSDKFLSDAEREALDDVEPFDEWEEFMLFARHYCVVHATASPADSLTAQRSPLQTTETKQHTARVTVENARSIPKRRFGEVFTLSDPVGRQFAIHLMGMGIQGRSDTYDVFALGRQDEPPQLPVSGPPPRVCCTVTDLGDFGVLLAGGRSSPATAFSDCWILKKGVECGWQPTWRLPIPLYRHSALRLKGSSLVLVYGGKTGPVQISDSCFVFYAGKGWIRYNVTGSPPMPSFGAVLCNSSKPNIAPGVFEGLLSGGLGRDSRVITQKYRWRLDVNEAQPEIFFEPVQSDDDQRGLLSVFGARTVELGSRTIVCGGMGNDISQQGQTMTVVETTERGCSVTDVRPSQDSDTGLPFMIGSSIFANGESLVTLGGGATCFSMGTYWQTGISKIDIGDIVGTGCSRASVLGTASNVKHVATMKITSGQHSPDTRQGAAISDGAKASVTAIPRVRLGPGKQFEDLLRDRQPVIIEGLNLGECMDKWQPSHMVDRVGHDKEVVVHECQRDTKKMDFNSKNFRYVTDGFGAVMERMQSGGRLYLRSLSQAKPTETPALLEEDFPGLATDFQLPPELDYVREHLFSSVLRVSGRVNMWLHYDVMANVYTQIQGSKRMILFPPTDVTHLSFAPGASSSSIDVFSALSTPSLSATHPHEALLQPGDVLLLPPMWLHAATPQTDMSVAVNVFFRDLGAGYAAGRDVYGNRDLAAYEKGRQDVARIGRAFDGLPGEIRRFYLARIADEILHSG